MSIADHVDVVRRFNRAYTQRIGALEDSFLGLGMPLSAARLVYEIGLVPGTVHALRERLSLDSGHLSRLLRRLEEEGLVGLKPDPDDRRRRIVSLTPHGRLRWAELEQRSEARAHTLIDPLTPRQRERLAAALAEADLLIRAATIVLADVDPASTQAHAAVDRYITELHGRFPGGFDVARHDGTDQDAGPFRPPAGAFVLAISDGEPVACGGLQTIAEGVGEIKRMWVHDGWRGAGLGSRLLRELERRAGELGQHTVRLDTNEALIEAIAMYERAGYRRIDRYNDNPYATHFFAKTLTVK